MTLETDLQGESEPEERLAHHEQLDRNDGSTDEKPIESEHDGEVSTEDFDVEEALADL